MILRRKRSLCTLVPGSQARLSAERIWRDGKGEPKVYLLLPRTHIGVGLISAIREQKHIDRQQLLFTLISFPYLFYTETYGYN